MAWFVIETVEGMDLDAFYAAYRADGHGRAAYEPSMMVTVILYAFATNLRSSRGIERHCRQDVAYRVITGNVVPDHATIARFVIRHERALGEVSVRVDTCAKAGLVLGVVGSTERSWRRTRVVTATLITVRSPARSSPRPARVTSRRTRSMVMRVGLLPRSSPPTRGAVRGPAGVGARSAPSRRARREPRDPDDEELPTGEGSGTCSTLRGSSRGCRAGRDGCGRASRQLDAERWEERSPQLRRSRRERLLDAGRRLDADLAAEARGNAAYEAFREHRRRA